VGLAVAVVTGQDHLVGAAVTEHALNLGVAGGVTGELLELATVTAAAQVGFNAGLRELQCKRAVRLVAAQAVTVGHGVVMSFMTVQAGHGITVLLVAFVAIHLTVGTGPLVHFLLWLFMAGDTDRLNR